MPAEGDGVGTISAVMVTYHRLALLKECVAAVRSQWRSPGEIIVVNNGGTDGTEEWLAEQDDSIVVNQGNSAGSGGYHLNLLPSGESKEPANFQARSVLMAPLFIGTPSKRWAI